MAFLLKKFTCDNPPGFTNPRFPSLMYHLKKAIYHLKQAPNAWFHHFSIFFFSHMGPLVASQIHTCLLLVIPLIFSFFYSMLTILSKLTTPSLVFSLLSPLLLSNLLWKNWEIFALFCECSLSVPCLGLFLSQHKYIYDLLLKFHLHTCKLVRIPIVAKTALSLSECELLAYLTDYRSMVGALQELTMYLTIPRFDIA